MSGNDWVGSQGDAPPDGHQMPRPKRRQGELVEVLARALHHSTCLDNPGHADWDGCETTGPCHGEAAEMAPTLQAHVDAEVAAALEGARDRVRAERDGYLDSEGLDRGWIAGWHSATDHHAARIPHRPRADPDVGRGCGVSGLSEGELRDLLDVDCDCGHGPDDHGSELFGCHLCPDYDEPRECPRSFLSLLAERLNGWADAREAAWRGEVDGLRARAWDEGWVAGCNDRQYSDDDDAKPWTPNPYARTNADSEPSSGPLSDERMSGDHPDTPSRRTAHSDPGTDWLTRGSKG